MRKRLKKALSIFMCTLILNLSIFNAAVMPAQASAALPLFYQLVQALLGIAGFELGFGTSLDGMTNDINSSVFANSINAWNNVGSVTLGSGYQVSDLRNKDNYLEFLSRALVLTVDYGIKEFGNKLYDALNIKSYKATGTQAMKSISDTLQGTIDYYAGDNADKLQQDLDTAFNVLTSDEVDSDVDMAAVDRIFSGMMSGYIAVSELPADNAWYDTVESEVYTGYSASDFDLPDSYYNSVYDSSKYYFQVKYDNGVVYEFRGFGAYKDIFFTPGTLSGTKRFMYYNGNYLYEIALPCYVYNTDGTLADETRSWFESSGSIVYCNIPYITSESKALEYFQGEKTNYGLVKNYYDITSISEFTNTIYASTAELSSTLDSFYAASPTASDVVGLSNTLTGSVAASAGTASAVEDVKTAVQSATDTITQATGEYTSILDRILSALLDILNSLLGDFLSAVSGITPAINNVGNLVGSLLDVFPVDLPDILDKILVFPTAIWDFFSEPITKIVDYVAAIAADVAAPWDGEDNDNSVDLLDILNILILLILIIIELLKIFYHCLDFIINIFKISPGTVFLPEDVLIGLNYIKTLEITGIGLSVYDFLMGLVYILIIFFVIRLLRVNIDRIRIPKKY